MNTALRLPGCSRTFLVSAMMVLALLFFSCSDLENPVDSNNPPATGETADLSISGGRSATTWTFMMYIAADAKIYSLYSPLRSTDLQSRFPSSDNVNVLCLEDMGGETAKIWYVDENHSAVMLEDIGEVNIGDVEVLSYFLDYAKTNYPADRYIMSFYGHGGGWGGACNDMDPQFSVLRMWEMKEALSSFGGVDLVLFTAPCLMGALESAYELRECTDVYCASENVSFFCIWNPVMSGLCAELNENPDIDNEKLGELVVEWMIDGRKEYGWSTAQRYLTMSSVRTSSLGALRDAIDDLASAYMADPARFRSLLDEVRKKILYFDNTSITDLRSVMVNLYREESDPGLKELIEKVNYRLAEAVINETHHTHFKDAGGLSIFLPDAATASLINYYVDDDEFGLDFPVDTGWDELLAAAFPPGTVAQAGPAGTFIPGSPLDRRTAERFLMQAAE